MRLYFLLFALFLVLPFGEMKRRKDQGPTKKQLLLQRKETTPVDFTRLLIMRIVYGFAKAIGLEEPISEVLNGALVPPGAEDDDEGDFFDY